MKTATFVYHHHYLTRSHSRRHGPQSKGALPPRQLLVFKCTKCPKTFQNPSDQHNHSVEHENYHGYHICHKVFGSLRNLNLHAKVHESPKFACPWSNCSRSFHTKVDLDRHEATHFPVAIHVCWICKRSYVYKNSLCKHERLAHPESGEELPDFHCSFPGCGHVSNTKAHLTQHALKHSEDKVNRCVCGEAFKWPSGLFRHRQKCAQGKTSTKPRKPAPPVKAQPKAKKKKSTKSKQLPKKVSTNGRSTSFLSHCVQNVCPPSMYQFVIQVAKIASAPHSADSVSVAG